MFQFHNKFPLSFPVYSDIPLLYNMRHRHLQGRLLHLCIHITPFAYHQYHPENTGQYMIPKDLLYY